MSIKDHKEDISIYNKSGGRIAMGRLSLAHNESKTITPILYPEDVINALNSFLARGQIEVTPVAKVNKKKPENPDVIEKESIKNDKGEKHQHTVYDPETAKRNKLIEVGDITDNGKAIQVGNDFKEVKASMTKEDAQDFLAQHWKKVEKEVDLINDVQKLEYILVVAKELGMNGNKKYELVEEKIESLKKQ